MGVWPQIPTQFPVLKNAGGVDFPFKTPSLFVQYLKFIIEK